MIDVGSELDYGRYDNSADIERWMAMYEGKPEWCNEHIEESELSAAIVSELSRKTTIEMESWIEGGEKGEDLNYGYSKLIEGARFTIEEMLVQGAVILKPFIDGYSKRIGVDVIGANSFIPLRFNSFNELEDVIFLDIEKKGDYVYTRYETHSRTDGIYKITNEVYLGLPNNSKNRGHKANLGDIKRWSHLSEHMEFELDTISMFVYMKAPFANKKDLGSPLGSSVLSKVEGLIRDHDDLYGKMMRDYHATRTIRYVPENYIETIDGRNKHFINDDTYVVVGNPSGDKKIEVISPESKNVSYIGGMEAILRRIEFNCGLAYGDLSKSDQNIKTATEILSSKERIYNTVEDIQKRVEYAFRDVVEVMSVMYDLDRGSKGQSVEVKFYFDDGIITAEDTNLRETSYII